MTQANYIRKTYVLCTYIQNELRNRYIYVHVSLSGPTRYVFFSCIALRGVLTSVLQESQGLITYAFVMLLLVMISLHMLTFRLMVTMEKLYLYSPVCNDTFSHAKIQFH